MYMLSSLKSRSVPSVKMLEGGTCALPKDPKHAIYAAEWKSGALLSACGDGKVGSGKALVVELVTLNLLGI